jgi:hypothetical protein
MKFLPWALCTVAITVLFGRIARSHQCDDTTVTQAIYSFLNAFNPGFNASIDKLLGEATMDYTGLYLTSTSSSDAVSKTGYGGFFLKDAISLQGDGGFSILFGVNATDGLNGGDAWDFIMADSGSREILPPPYSPDGASYGRSGWSRRNSLVVEFSNKNNVPGNPATYQTSIAVFLNGSQVCRTEVPEINLTNGTLHYVWIDFFGLFSAIDVRVSISADRPESANLQCQVNLWGVMNMKASNHIGFEAYNPLNTTGAKHSIAEVLSYYDAYRYDDSIKGEQCAVYSWCSQRSQSSLCTELTAATVVGTTNIPCQILACAPSFYRNPDGTDCCLYAEGGSWVPKDRTVPAGGYTTCDAIRATKIFNTSLSNCLPIPAM